ncbi:MAG: leucyl/phenylalanyl-tRNA--protein transferase [Pseudomonadales bacterium]|nr:leucyl/phenylalanyl-tRNA--protein transferase [Pseudomonadales bacterium]
MIAAKQQGFPPIEQALNDPDGLLAIGGDLSVARLVEAYSLGIFPWYENDEPIMWWSPKSRAVIAPDQVHVSRSLKKTLRQNNFILTIDQDFNAVIDHCALAHRKTDGTWITEDMLEAYKQLHLSGHAHSFEVWDKGQLIGGLYGIASGKVFSGESMFHHKTDASKIAFIYTCLHLQSLNFSLLDCQIQNPHLASLGVMTLSRDDFKRYLLACKSGTDPSDETGISPYYNWNSSHLSNSQDLLERIDELT